MAGFDVRSSITPFNPLTNTRNAPTVAALKAAIAGSAVSASYPASVLSASSKLDLVNICRIHGISV
jgi:hypothetical protein